MTAASDGGRDGEVPASRTYRHPDPTTAADRRRIRDARLAAREEVRAEGRDGPRSLRHVFRREIGSKVRSATPFALALVASAGESIDLMLGRIAPAPRWPRSPALSERPAAVFRRPREPHRRFVVRTADGDQEVIRLRGFGHGVTFMRSGGDWARLEVVDHSVEVEARIGPVRIETLFGILRIELDHALPDTLAAACVGRPVFEVVDHPALRGRQWPIVFSEEPPSPTFGQTLVAETGSVAFRMPWVR